MNVLKAVFLILFAPIALAIVIVMALVAGMGIVMLRLGMGWITIISNMYDRQAWTHRWVVVDGVPTFKRMTKLEAREFDAKQFGRRVDIQTDKSHVN